MATSPLPLVIAIEANIGAGKSTQIARLQKLFEGNDRIVVLPEPVDDWVKVASSRRCTTTPTTHGC